MPAKRHTLADLKDQWEVLQKDLLRAYHHYRLYREIHQAYDDYAQEIRGSYAFWNLTYGANRDFAIHSLCRFYDMAPATLTLKGFLELVESSSDLFLDAQLTAPDPLQLQLDKRSVDQRLNPVVKTLMVYRHQFLAHRNRDLALNNEAFLKEWPLAFSEISGLFDEGIGILERYGYLFGVNVLTRNLLGHDDFLKLLQIVRVRNSET